MTPPLYTFSHVVSYKLEIFRLIGLNLDPKDIVICTLVSRMFNHFCKSNSLWKSLCERDFPLLMQTTSATVYKDLYISFYRSKRKSSLLPPYLINLEPITLKGLKIHNPQTLRIYTGKEGTVPAFIPCGENRTGKSIIGARIVKIDPGFCFTFTKEGECSRNWIINTKELLGHPSLHLKDLRDLQTSTNNVDIVVLWKCLLPSQQEEFLAALLNSVRYLRSKQVFSFLFHREGLFNRSDLEYVPKYFLDEKQKLLENWATEQLKIYEKDLQQFKEYHPEQLLRIHYIDNWGEISLPMAKETFPIRELYTSLQIVKQAKDRIELPDLFQLHEGKEPRKILLIGQPGIGKSTLCQKMAHDWSSGQLWEGKFDVVYWIPLRALHHHKIENEDLFLWLAKVIKDLILKDQISIKSLRDYIEEHREKSLWILDGYDEATPQLQALVNLLLQEKELTIVLTSRPGVTDFLISLIDLHVENIGFSKDQIETYAEQFFARKDLKGDCPLFLKTLRMQKNLLEMAHIPLQLQMICSLWEQKRETLVSHLTGLYQQMIEELLKWNRKRLPFSSQELNRLLHLLSKIAAHSLHQRSLIIAPSIIKKTLIGTQFTIEHLRATGLLKESAEGAVFLHLSFQEYLVAKFLMFQGIEKQKAFILNQFDTQNGDIIFVRDDRPF